MKREREEEEDNLSNKKFKTVNNIDKSVYYKKERIRNNVKRLEPCKEPLDKDIIINHLSAILCKLDYEIEECYMCGWISHSEENWLKCKNCDESICEICSGWATHNSYKCDKIYSCIGRSYEPCKGLDYNSNKPKVLCSDCSKEQYISLEFKDDSQ